MPCTIARAPLTHSPPRVLINFILNLAHMETRAEKRRACPLPSPFRKKHAFFICTLYSPKTRLQAFKYSLAKAFYYPCHPEPREGSLLEYCPMCHFSRAQASGEIFGKILQGFYTVCLATLTAYRPRAAGQRPVRLAAVWRLAQGDTKGSNCAALRAALFRITGGVSPLCHPEPVEGSLI